jgi:hypothetical protein
LAETYFPTGFSRLPSPEDPEYRQAVTLYSDKFEAISSPSDFCSMKNDQRGGVYSLFGAEVMESGYLTGLDNDLVQVPEGIESPPKGLLRAIGERPENDVIRADCLDTPPDHLSTVTPDHENESEQLIAPIFLGANGGHSSKPGGQRGIAPGQMGRPSSPNNGIIYQLSRAGSEISDRTSGETENSFSILPLPEMGEGNHAGMEGRLAPPPGANERGPQLSSIGSTEGQSVGAGEGEIYKSHRTPDDVTLHARATRANSPSDWPSESGDGRGLTTKAHKRSGSGRLQLVCLERSLRAHVRVNSFFLITRLLRWRVIVLSPLRGQGLRGLLSPLGLFLGVRHPLGVIPPPQLLRLMTLVRLTTHVRLVQQVRLMTSVRPRRPVRLLNLIRSPNQVQLKILVR